MKKWNWKHFDIISSVFTFVIMIIISGYVIRNYIKLYTDKQYADVITCSDSLNAQIYDSIMEPFSKVMAIAELQKSTETSENQENKAIEKSTTFIIPNQIESIYNSTNISAILFAPDNQISGVFPPEKEESYLNLDYESLFQSDMGKRKMERPSGPYIEGPFINPRTNHQAMASLVPIHLTGERGPQYWGYVAVVLDYPEMFSKVRFDIMDERNILCKIERLNEYTGQKSLILETKEPFPKKITSSVVTCSKVYFTTQFITSLEPKKHYYNDISFVLFAFFLIWLSIVVPIIIYSTIKNFLRTQDLKYYKVQSELVTAQAHTIHSLSSLVENRDSDTGSHIQRTSDYVYMLAKQVKKAGLYTDILTDSYIEMLKDAAPMHDIGKIVVPDSVLKKPGKLTDEEFEQIKAHTIEGGRIIKDILEPIQTPEFVQITKDIVTSHHEKWNGKGYPKGLKENEIPLSARIMALADVFDALTSPRCYKEPFPFNEAINIIKKDAGTHFDPQLAEIFINNETKLLEIKEKYKD